MRLPLCFLVALLAQGAAAAPQTYQLDPEHSFVWFEVVHFGTSTLRGRFGPITGEATLDTAAGRGEVGLRIATAGVATGVPALDARLAHADMLDNPGYPEAFYVSRNFRFEGGRLAELRGEFTLRGASHPLALRALRFGCRTIENREVCGGDFEAQFNRSEYGITFGLPFVADRVRLLIQVEGSRALR